MLKRSKKKIAKIASLILSAALFIPAMYGMTVKDFVRADDTVAKTTSNTKLGVDQMSDPVIQFGGNKYWHGSYVYFGIYGDQPLKFRVLDKDSTKYTADGSKTLFLDSDRCLYKQAFNTTLPYSDPNSIKWSESDILVSLNGVSFLNKDGVFTQTEKDAIAESYVADAPLTGDNSDVNDLFRTYVGLNGEKVFLLDITDILNHDYGYYDLDDFDTPHYSNLYKYGLESYNWWNDGNLVWWLRSGSKIVHDELEDKDVHHVGIATLEYYGVERVDNENVAVAPALNIDHDSILFSTAVNGSYGALETEYKLTLLDPEMIVLVPDGSVSMDGNKVTFGTKFSGQNVYNVSRVSYMITSKTIGSDGNSILDYGTTHGGNGTGYLTLPNSISGTWGEDYHIYVFAETLNGPYESDYASAPVELVKQQTPDPIDFEGKNLSNTQLGTNGMSSPSVPQTPDDKWNGSYVYFGKYEGQPVLYRVLDPDTDIFGSRTLFLDSDYGLYSDCFSENNQTNLWKDCDIRYGLNGDKFLNKEGVFTSVEKASIAESTIASHPLAVANQSANDMYEYYVGLEGDKVFILDAEDTYNGKYGYINGYDGLGGYSNYWKIFQPENRVWACWLRNAAGEKYYLYAGIVPQNPSMEVIGEYSVAPALNVSQDSILFSTALKGKYGELGTEYKLTLLDPEMIVSVPDNSASMDGGKVTFSYTLSGQRFAERSQISYIVTSKTLGSDGNSILDYGAIHGGNNKGYFTLSNSVSGTWGEDYHIYVFAEKINGACETDYAGIPVEITAPVPRPKIVSHAIRLSGSIGVKFGVDFPDGTDVSKCYVEFVTTTGRKTTVRTSSAGETDSSRYYIFSINCLEMADEITATLYYDGEAIQTDKYSAMSYIEYLQNHTQDFDSRIIDLVNALHTYGYYMQQSNWSDSVNHTAIPKPSEILTSLDVDRAVTKLNMDTFCDIRKNMGTSGISSDVMVSLTLTSVTTLKIYVKPENSSVIMPRNSTSVNLNGEKYYVFSVSNIAPNHLDTQRRFEIKTNQGTATISLPALFYVKTMLNYGLTTQAQKLALTAYYRYYEAAKALVG